MAALQIRLNFKPGSQRGLSLVLKLFTKLRMVRLLHCFQKWHKVKFFPHTPALPSSNILQECQQMPTAQHTHRASPILNPFIHQLSLRNKIVWDDLTQSSNENSPYSGLKSCQRTHTVTHTPTTCNANASKSVKDYPLEKKAHFAARGGESR